MYYFTATLAFVFLWTLCSSQVLVKTTVGKILGTKETLTVDGQEKNVTKFFGIPFAETTAGVNRFQKPVPKAPFVDVFSATETPKACIQATVYAEQNYNKFTNYSEDCLVLNIYVPHDFQGSHHLPVMVWIYGGGFTEGASNAYPAEVLSAFGNVIVVTLNYRIGMFGFLRSADGQLIGNQGLWDQHLGIKWVHDNIGAFSGNADDVTIFGESAGGASVLHQALYPGNKGLFQRVIAESGAALAYWSLLPEPNAEKYINLTSCYGQNDAIPCLKSLSPQDLQVDYGLILNETITFRPYYDNDFFIGTPQEIMLGNSKSTESARNFFASLDIVVGVNNYDGVLVASLIKEIAESYMNENFTVTREMFENTIIPFVIRTMFTSVTDGQEQLLRPVLDFAYTDWENPDDPYDLRVKMMDLFTDGMFIYPAVATAHSHSSLGMGRTYMYLFSAELDKHLLPTPNWIAGSNHADELDFVFGYPLSEMTGMWNRTHSDEEKDLARAMVTLWTNFANTGIPNVPNAVADVCGYTSDWWAPYSPDAQNYLNIGITQATLEERPVARRMKLWSQLLPEILNSHIGPTQSPAAPFVHIPNILIGK